MGRINNIFVSVFFFSLILLSVGVVVAQEDVCNGDNSPAYCDFREGLNVETADGVSLGVAWTKLKKGVGDDSIEGSVQKIIEGAGFTDVGRKNLRTILTEGVTGFDATSADRAAIIKGAAATESGLNGILGYGQPDGTPKYVASVKSLEGVTEVDYIAASMVGFVPDYASAMLKFKGGDKVANFPLENVHDSFNQIELGADDDGKLYSTYSNGGSENDRSLVYGDRLLYSEEGSEAVHIRGMSDSNGKVLGAEYSSSFVFGDGKNVGSVTISDEGARVAGQVNFNLGKEGAEEGLVVRSVSDDKNGFIFGIGPKGSIRPVELQPGVKAQMLFRPDGVGSSNNEFKLELGADGAESPEIDFFGDANLDLSDELGDYYGRQVSISKEGSGDNVEYLVEGNVKDVDEMKMTAPGGKFAEGSKLKTKGGEFKKGKKTSGLEEGEEDPNEVFWGENANDYVHITGGEGTEGAEVKTRPVSIANINAAKGGTKSTALTFEQVEALGELKVFTEKVTEDDGTVFENTPTRNGKPMYTAGKKDVNGNEILYYKDAEGNLHPVKGASSGPTAGNANTGTPTGTGSVYRRGWYPGKYLLFGGRGGGWYPGKWIQRARSGGWYPGKNVIRAVRWVGRRIGRIFGWLFGWRVHLALFQLLLFFKMSKFGLTKYPYLK